MSFPDSASDGNRQPRYTPGAPLAIPARYRGCRFRSRLEARWAVFFDHMGIGWQYEPERYPVAGGTYLPDFLLECGTWVEVKGHDQFLNQDLMRSAALELPKMPAKEERGPRLLLLGPTPMPYLEAEPGDHGWLGLDLDGRGRELIYGTYGFGRYYKNRRPWWFDYRTEEGPWLRPSFEEWEPDTSAAYAAANGARFEFGESGAV